MGTKRPGREVNRSPPSSAEIKMSGAMCLLPQYAFTAWTGGKYLFVKKIKPDAASDIRKTTRPRRF